MGAYVKHAGAMVQGVYYEYLRLPSRHPDTASQEYHQTFARAVEELQAAQQQQLDTCAQELEAKRPMKPKPSRDYLNQKKVEVSQKVYGVWGLKGRLIHHTIF